MIQQAALTLPKQAFLAAGAAAVVASAAVVQAPVVAPQLTALTDSAVALLSAAVPADVTSMDLATPDASPSLWDSLDPASLDVSALAAPVGGIDGIDGGTAVPDFSGILDELTQQVAGSAVSLNISVNIFQFLAGIGGFLWSVVTWPIHIVEQLINDVFGLL